MRHSLRQGFFKQQIIFLLIWVFHFSASAQRWDEDPASLQDKPVFGAILTKDGDTLRTEFSFNLQNDMVQVREQNRIRTFSARQIKYFYFIEPNTEKSRFFFSLQFSERQGYRADMFFELLQEGESISLLGREYVIMESIPMQDPFTGMGRVVSRPRLVYEHYLRPSGGAVVKFQGRKKDFLKLGHPHEKELESFIKERKINLNKTLQLMEAVAFLNELLAQKSN